MTQPPPENPVRKLREAAQVVIGSMPLPLTATAAFHRDGALALYGQDRGERVPLVLVELPVQRKPGERRTLVVLDPGGDAVGNYNPAPYTAEIAMTYARLAAESGATLIAPSGGGADVSGKGSDHSAGARGGDCGDLAGL